MRAKKNRQPRPKKARSLLADVNAAPDLSGRVIDFGNPIDMSHHGED